MDAAGSRLPDEPGCAPGLGHARGVGELTIQIDSSEPLPVALLSARIERGPLAVGD